MSMNIKFWFPLLLHSTHNNMILGVRCRSEKFKMTLYVAVWSLITVVWIPYSLNDQFVFDFDLDLG